MNGLLARDRLLDVVEYFILFDDSRAGGTRKIVARNHQILGVNNAVASVQRQEDLKRDFPKEARLVEFRIPRRKELAAADPTPTVDVPLASGKTESSLLPLVKRAHPDLGRLGVFWHTQGSGKSYSMAFFAEKVRRVVPGNFTFLIMTDREDLDDQIWRTFIGCGLADEKSPRDGSGRGLAKLLQGNHRYVFSLIHKFNKPVTKPYSERDDIIVISDEAHRTQAGSFARNMRLALPYAAFLGFTGTPLFKDDELTRRIFGNYVSRYDFRRSEEDQSTVRLADDFVDHASLRWQSGKSMLVCMDKITCARMFKRVQPRWKMKIAQLKGLINREEAELAHSSDCDVRERLAIVIDRLRSRTRWMETTRAEVRIFVLDNLYRALPRPPYTDKETENIAERVYDYVRQRSAGGHGLDVA